MTDEPLDAARVALVPALLAHVPFDGWSAATLRRACADRAVPPGRGALLYPGGAIDMVAAFVAWADAQMVAALSAEQLAALKIRARVTLAVRTRLELVAPHREAVRRAAAVLANPRYAARAARQTWGTADAIWRLCGDTATDYNHYTKRALLSSVYAATLLYWITDASSGSADTWAFLDRRIAGIMHFEKIKAQLVRAGDQVPSLTRFLGRLRYPG